MNAIKGVLLDLDGTLIDAFPPIVRAMKKTLHIFNLPDMSEHEIRRHTGRGDCSMSALFGDHKKEAIQHFIAIHDETYLNDIKALPGAESLLAWLEAQYIPMAIVTSKGQHRAQAQLEKLGWLQRFSCVIGKQEGRATKPSPEPLLLACDNMGLPIKAMIMVGDGEADMQAAHRAGCVAVGLSSSFTDKELGEAGANHCFSSLNEVLLWLKTQIS